MGLSSYLMHHKRFIFSVILKHWENYKSILIHNLKVMKDVVWSRDGQFDSMGHSAKYGAYTMFCSTILKVVHF